MSLSAMFTQARRALFAALALAAAPAALTTSAEARDYEIVITISQLTALDAADVWLAGPDDFYARVTIDGEVFSTRIKRQQNVAQPNWKISKVVSNRKVDVRLEIYDKDIGKPDDKIDINRITPKRDLDFVVDTRRCRVEGFADSFRCGDEIRRQGNEDKKAEIVFYVDAERY